MRYHRGRSERERRERRESQVYLFDGNWKGLILSQSLLI